MNLDLLQSLPAFGTAVLCAVLVASGYTFAVAVVAARGRPRLLRVARLGSYATSSLVLLGVLLLAYAFVAHDFRLRYVARYSDRSMSLAYLLTALWGGQDGSLLWWLGLQCGFIAAAVAWLGRRYRELQPYVVATLMGVVGFFAVLMLFAANPFETFLSGGRLDGNGLNPMLQNYWMILHPPALYLGFVGCTVPFAFAVAALVSGRLTNEWVVATRKWMLLAWLFLSVGNALGMVWAYEELGWGGYWAWDPVENAGLLPWLSASAYVHSTIIQERRDRLKAWNVVLICLTFLLTIFGTFLTRSGLIASVHSFARSGIGVFFVWYLAAVTVTCAGLIAWRWPLLRQPTRFESLASRETTFVINNWALVSLLAFVGVATTLPLLSEWLRGDAMTVGPPFFNRWAKPFGLFLLLLMGLCPLFGWGKTSAPALRRSLPAPLAALVVGAAAHLAFGSSLGMPAIVPDQATTAGSTGALLRQLDAWVPVVTVSLVCFNLAVVVQEFVRGITARRRAAAGRDRPENVLVAGLRLVGRNRRRYGGYVVHVGVASMFLGFVGSSWVIHHETTLVPGQDHRIGPYELVFERTRICPGDQGCTAAEQSDQSKRMLFADFAVRRDGRAVGHVSPAKFVYRRMPEAPTSEVGLLRSLRDDLYVVAGSIGGPGEPSSFRFYVNPLVSFIWLGLVGLIAGTAISLWPEPGKHALGPWDTVKERTKPGPGSTPPARVARWAIPIGVVTAAWIVAAVWTVAWAIWVLAAAALLLAILLLWDSILGLNVGTSLSLEEALSLAAPTAAEEQKRALLRAMKDLEFERAVGKISETDHAELSAQYRRQARELLREVDRYLGPARTRAKAELEQRLRTAKPSDRHADSCTDTSKSGSDPSNTSPSTDSSAHDRKIPPPEEPER